MSDTPRTAAFALKDGGNLLSEADYDFAASLEQESNMLLEALKEMQTRNRGYIPRKVAEAIMDAEKARES